MYNAFTLQFHPIGSDNWDQDFAETLRLADRFP